MKDYFFYEPITSKNHIKSNQMQEFRKERNVEKVTLRLSEPGDDVMVELVGKLARLTTAPLVVDGHLESRPL